MEHYGESLISSNSHNSPLRRARWELNYFMDGGENISSQPLESLIRDKEQKGAESSKLAHYDVYTLTEPAKTQEGKKL